ncbi:hypothetical protein BDQ17DRAFT_1411118 [Cyathus striatus]|nr:hypothetical protein BDQ17DRAFT_1411118 [Cyathus striatus]
MRVKERSTFNTMLVVGIKSISPFKHKSGFLSFRRFPSARCGYFRLRQDSDQEFQIGIWTWKSWAYYHFEGFVEDIIISTVIAHSDLDTETKLAVSKAVNKTSSQDTISRKLNKHKQRKKKFGLSTYLTGQYLLFYPNPYYNLLRDLALKRRHLIIKPLIPQIYRARGNKATLGPPQPKSLTSSSKQNQDEPEYITKYPIWDSETNLIVELGWQIHAYVRCKDMIILRKG